MRIAARLTPILLLAACSGADEGPTTGATGTTSTTGGGSGATSSAGPADTSEGTPTTASAGPTSADTGATAMSGEETTAHGSTTGTTTTGLTATAGDTSSSGEPPGCMPGDMTGCYSGDPDKQDVGLCKGGVTTCDDQGVWGPCDGEVLPTAESCETPGDEDCDGVDPCGAGVYKWHKFWGGNSDERGLRIGFDATGALILAAQGASTSDFGGGPLVSAGSWDLYLAKFAPDGAHVWSKRFGDAMPQFGEGWALAVDPGGEFVVAGGFEGAMDLGGGALVSQSILDVFVGKFSGDGAHVWSKAYKAGSYAKPEGLAIDGDGEIYMGGYFTDSLDLGGGQMIAQGLAKDAFVGKFTAAGAHVWSLRFGDTSDQYIEALVVDPDGNATIGGHFAGTMNPGTGNLVSAGSDDAFVAQFDPIGNAVWAKKFGDAQPQQILGVARAPNGRITVVGAFEGAIDFGGGPLMAASDRGFVAQLEPDGTFVWAKLLADGEAYPQAIAADGFGSLVATGWFTTTSDFGGGKLVAQGDHDLFVVKLAPGGEHVWSAGFGDEKVQDGMAVAASADGVMAVTGGYFGSMNLGGGPVNAKGGYDGFLGVFAP